MQVLCFCATSSPSCATICLRQTAIDFGNLFDPEISCIIQQNFYVDDCLCSTSDSKRAKIIVQQLTEFLRKGSFRLTKWLTNNLKVLEYIDVKTNERVLGVLWNVLIDTFGFNITLPHKPVIEGVSYSSELFVRPSWLCSEGAAGGGGHGAIPPL